MPSSSRPPPSVGEARVAEHDRHDRVLAGPDGEAGRGHRPRNRGCWPRAGRAAPSPPTASPGRRATRDERRRQRVGEEVGPRALAQELDDLAPARREAAGGAAERLAQRGGDDVDAPGDAAVLGRAAAGLAEEAGGVAVVHHHERVVALGQVADLGERRDVAVHGEHAVGGDQPRPRAARPPVSCRSSSSRSPCA